MACLILRALILKSMRWVDVVFQMRMLTTSVKVVTTVSNALSFKSKANLSGSEKSLIRLVRQVPLI